MIEYIFNNTHYQEVISRTLSVKRTLWIGTADIKDLYVEVGKEKTPFLALIAQLIRRGVVINWKTIIMHWLMLRHVPG